MTKGPIHFAVDGVGYEMVAAQFGCEIGAIGMPYVVVQDQGSDEENLAAAERLVRSLVVASVGAGTATTAAYR